MKIPYGKQNITQDDIDAVSEVLRSDFLTQGPIVGTFESNFSKYVDSKYSVAVSSGTMALHIAVKALGIKKGDRVITTPITFAASANCVLYEGGEIDFCDIDPDTYNLDLGKLEELISQKPEGYYSGVICVDFAGLPVNTELLSKITTRHGLWLIEDACHAPGGGYIDSKNEVVKCGSNKYTDATIFSFHPVKHIAAGEGGLVTTNNSELRDRLNLFRTHGITKNNLEYSGVNKEDQGAWYYEMQDLGYNGRITDFQCALANSQLNRAEEGVKRRLEIAQLYENAFSKVGIKFQKVTKGVTNAHHLFVIEVDSRKELYEFLQSKDILVQVHYLPIHLMPYYKQFGFDKGDYPMAENYYNSCLSLPMFPTLTDEEQRYVIDSVLGFIQKA